MLRNTIMTCLIVGFTAPALAADYTLDPAHTYPHFEINHLGFSTMHGRFDKTEGTMTFDQEAGTGSVEVIIDANSISTGYAKRDDHLRSPDFLNAAEFPEITFKSTSFEMDDDSEATVEGELTILGVTQPVTLDVEDISCGENPMSGNETCGFGASAEIKRSDFGMNYGIPNLGDEMELNFEVEAIKN